MFTTPTSTITTPIGDRPSLRHGPRVPWRALGFWLGFASLGIGCGPSGPSDVSFSLSAASIEAYDFVELTAQISRPRAPNPFTDATFKGWFESIDERRR